MEYDIKLVKDVVESDFNNMVNFYPDCFDGTMNFHTANMLNKGNIYVMSVKYENMYIFMCLLHPVLNNVYISDVCVRKEWRGKGIMESAFKYITEYYGKRGKYYLTLTASKEENQGLNQQKRIKIFNKHDFYLSPTHISVSGYGSDDNAPISVSLANGQSLNIKSGPLKKIGIKSKYLATDSNGNSFQISMDEIEACFTKSLLGSNQVHCPMKKTLKKGGFRATKKRSHLRKI